MFTSQTQQKLMEIILSVNKKANEICIGDVLVYRSQNTIKKFGAVSEINRYGDAFMFKVNDHSYRRHMSNDEVMVEG